MLVDKVWLFNLILQQIVLLLLSRLVDIVAKCCLRPIVIVIPNVAILRFVDIISVQWLEHTFIVIIKVVVILDGTIVVQKLVLGHHLILIDNDFIVLAGFVKEGVKGHDTCIHVFLLARDLLPLLLLLLPLLWRQLTFLARWSSRSPPGTFATSVPRWPRCLMLLLLQFGVRHHG